MRPQPFIVAGESQSGVQLAQKFGGGFFGQMPTDEAGVEVKYAACLEGGAEVPGVQDETSLVPTDDGSLCCRNSKFV